MGTFLPTELIRRKVPLETIVRREKIRGTASRIVGWEKKEGHRRWSREWRKLMGVQVFLDAMQAASAGSTGGGRGELEEEEEEEEGSW